MRTRLRLMSTIAALASTALVASAAAALTASTLPAGTSISIDNTSPTDGAQYLIPIGDSTLAVTDQGTANVGGGAVVKDTSVVFVLDVSGSTGNSSGVDCNGVAGNDSVLVCEKVGALAVNTAAALPNSVVTDAAVVSFAGGAAIQQALTTDFTQTASAINGLSAGGATNYVAAVGQAQTALAASTQPKKIVIFLSDGFPNPPGAFPTPFGADTIVRSFAVGAPSVVSCSGQAGTDLNAVAALGATGSGCQQVTDPSTLADVITQAIGSTLGSVEISVDGGAYSAIPAADLDATLPIGPDFANKTVNWSTAAGDLGPGTHTICVRARGADAGGNGSVEECKTITLLQLQADSDLEATNELGTDGSHTVSVVVAGSGAGTAVTFAVSGVNGGAGDVVLTDADGKASFTFTSPQDPSGLGDDTIDVSITVGGETQTISFVKHWVDTTAPVGACVPSVNPGGNEPQAPGRGARGQNQDGFYEVGGADDIWPAADTQVFVTDEASGTTFGPYAPGTVIKYTQAPGGTPNAKGIGGANSAVTVHITGNGDALVTAVDGSGNVSDAVSCLVPPPPA